MLRFVSIFSALLLAGVMVQAEAPSRRELADPVRLEASGKPISADVGDAAPALADMDGDGKQDLLVGQCEHGRLRVYRNIGTSDHPKYGDFSWFQAGGVEARLPRDDNYGFYPFKPHCLDIDGDERLDMLTGTSPGQLLYFRGLKDRQFAAAAVIRERRGRPLSLGEYTTPVAADWDSDGDSDLVVGNGKGLVFVVQNSGTRKRAVFDKYVQLYADKRPLSVDKHAAPAVADWDNDGKQDLIVGADDGRVALFRNIGTSKKPILAAPHLLKSAVPKKDEENVRSHSGKPIPGLECKICVADYNGDGKLDLLVGDSWPNVTVYRGPLNKEEQAQKDALEARKKELLVKVPHLNFEVVGGGVMHLLPQNKRDEAIVDELTKVQRELFKFAPEYIESFGWIWFYRRTEIQSAEDTKGKPEK